MIADKTNPIQLAPGVPALILAPMEGLMDAPMRALHGETAAFSFSVSEFLRVSSEVPPARVFLRHVPELLHGARTPTGMAVQVQLLGGDPERMAGAALVACAAGATAIDLNFGCPAPTVNRHDGGASLLRHPQRLREIVAAVRAAMAAEGGASWLTIHGRTRTDGYRPPAQWEPIGRVRRNLDIPVVANGDIWCLDSFRRCQDATGCCHFMLGRGALADPLMPGKIAHELGLVPAPPTLASFGWPIALQRLAELMRSSAPGSEKQIVCRVKQWLKIAGVFGDFAGFDEIKRAETLEEILAYFSVPGVCRAA
jgi:tRNA-dihydrouridine synthase C